MNEKADFKKNPYWISLKSDQDEVFLSGEMVICSHCTLGGNHLLGSSCYVCGFSTWNWGIFIQKRFLTWTKGHCIWVFVLKRAAWANAACKLHGFTADWLQHSQLRVLTHSASACAGFLHPIFAHNIIYRHLGRKTQLMKSACAEGSLSLCWDSEISDLRIEILGRMTASFLTLVAEV